MDPSIVQRSHALSRAQWVRSERARARREMTAEHAAAVVLDPPDWAATWRLGDMLAAIPGVGPRRLGRLLRRAGGDHLCPLASVEPQVAAQLASQLRGSRPGAAG